MIECEPLEKKLSVGDTLSETFSIYRDQAGVLLPAAFWLFLAVSIAELLAGDNELSLFLVSLVLGLAITFLYEGMVVALVKDVRDGRRDHSVGDTMRSVLPVLFPLVGAGVVVAFGATVTAPIEGLVASVLYFRLLDLQPQPASDSSASAAAESPPAAS